MKTGLFRFWPLCAALIGSLFLTSPALAADPIQQHNSSAIWFENWTGLSNATLVISAPDGVVTEVFAASGTPVFELERGEATDGMYFYELRAATEERQKVVNQIDSGRGAEQRDMAAVPFLLNGSFLVERGAIVAPEEIKEEDG